MPSHLHALLFDRVLLSQDGGLPGIPGSGGSGPTGISGSQPSGPSLDKPRVDQPSLDKPWAQPAPPSGPPSGGQPPVFQQPEPPVPGSPASTGGTFELSGWWRRVGATLIDGLIMVVILIPLTIAAFAVFGLSLDDSNGNVDNGDAGLAIASLLTIFALYVVVILFYAPATMARMNGATPGKKATGIRVVRADGLPITFGFAVLREVVFKALVIGVASNLTVGLAYLLDVLWPLWDSEHRSLHDMMAKTRVVRA